MRRLWLRLQRIVARDRLDADLREEIETHRALRQDALERTGLDNPPPVTHPEFYYGFVGVALAFQLVFLTIASDPLKYRPLILAGIGWLIIIG